MQIKEIDTILTPGGMLFQIMLSKTGRKPQKVFMTVRQEITQDKENVLSIFNTLNSEKTNKKLKWTAKHKFYNDKQELIVLLRQVKSSITYSNLSTNLKNTVLITIKF